VLGPSLPTEQQGLYLGPYGAVQMSAEGLIMSQGVVARVAGFLIKMSQAPLKSMLFG